MPLMGVTDKKIKEWDKHWVLNCAQQKAYKEWKVWQNHPVRIEISMIMSNKYKIIQK